MEVKRRWCWIMHLFFKQGQNARKALAEGKVLMLFVYIWRRGVIH